MPEPSTAEQLALLPPTEPTDPPGRRPGTVVAFVLAGIFFASTVLLAFVAAQLKSDKDDAVATGVEAPEEVLETAGRFVEALLSYDHRDPGGYRDRVLALTAPPFREQFEEAVTSLEQDFAVTEQVSTPTIKDLFVSEVGEEDASAIVVYDRVVSGVGGDRTERNLYVRLGLIRLDEGWRINEVVNLNFAFAGSSPESTTTTIAG